MLSLIGVAIIAATAGACLGLVACALCVAAGRTPPPRDE